MALLRKVTAILRIRRIVRKKNSKINDLICKLKLFFKNQFKRSEKMDTNKSAPNTENATEENILNATLSAFESFVSEMSAGAIGSSADAETKQMIVTTSSSLQSQFKKITEFARTNYSSLNVGKKAEVDIFLRIQEGIQIGNSGTETTQKAFKSGWFIKFLRWALHWFKEIKKILREIVAMILDALGIRFPKWLETIFLLLDQFFDALVSLLSDVFGLDVSKFAAEASRAEVNHINELYAVERLRSLRNVQKTNEDE